MNEVVNSPESPKAKNVKLIYILYLVNIVVPFCGLVGLIMAYVNKADAPEWLQSHYQFIIRTFWISLLYGLIAVILIALVITSIIGFPMLLFVLVWLIVRCVKAMGLVDQGQPHPNPTGWLF